uniref:Uncharacterized protein n=1 Tax=Oryza glaberrima TaxID=4538 RepID=I1QZQ4_ORYGL
MATRGRWRRLWVGVDSGEPVTGKTEEVADRDRLDLGRRALLARGRAAPPDRPSFCSTLTVVTVAAVSVAPSCLRLNHRRREGGEERGRDEERKREWRGNVKP